MCFMLNKILQLIHEELFDGALWEMKDEQCKRRQE